MTARVLSHASQTSENTCFFEGRFGKNKNLQSPVPVQRTLALVLQVKKEPFDRVLESIFPFKSNAATTATTK